MHSSQCNILSSPTVIWFCVFYQITAASTFFSSASTPEGKKLVSILKKQRRLRFLLPHRPIEGFFGLSCFLRWAGSRNPQLPDSDSYFKFFFFLRAKANLKKIGSSIQVKPVEGQFPLQHEFGYALMCVPWKGVWFLTLHAA